MENEMNSVTRENQLPKLLKDSIKLKFNQKYVQHELRTIYSRGLCCEMNNYQFRELNPQLEGRIEVIIVVGGYWGLEKKYFHISGKTDPLNYENVEYFINNLEIFEMTLKEYSCTKYIYGTKIVFTICSKYKCKIN